MKKIICLSFPLLINIWVVYSIFPIINSLYEYFIHVFLYPYLLIPLGNILRNKHWKYMCSNLGDSRIESKIYISFCYLIVILFFVFLLNDE